MTVKRLELELTPACDHRCAHCYVVWNANSHTQNAYPRGQLDTRAFLAMMEKAVEESGAKHLTLTGGEPLLRKDAMTIIEHAGKLVPSLRVVTNGSHVTEAAAADLERYGVKSVQLTLLSADRDTHNALKGADCFDDTVRAALNLRDQGILVNACFVAMKQNWEAFEGVMELCFALGIKYMAYNRMSPTGWAVDDIARLMPEPQHIEANLNTAEKLGRRFGIRVDTAMPIPPCLIRIHRYKHVKFGFCSAGSVKPNFVIDPQGNVRTCNLSSRILGNITKQPFAKIMQNRYIKALSKELPKICRGCRYAKSCRGGCKESAHATFGALTEQDPFVQFALEHQKNMSVFL